MMGRLLSTRGRIPEGRRLEDDASLLLRYKRGARGVLCASLQAFAGFWEFELVTGDELIVGCQSCFAGHGVFAPKGTMLRRLPIAALLRRQHRREFLESSAVSQLR